MTIRNVTYSRQLILAVLLTTSLSHARLGDGPGIDVLIARSDVVCAGKISNYDIVPVSSNHTSMWLVAKFKVDHKIKGAFLTNVLTIVIAQLEQPENAKSIIDHLASQTESPRCLIFLKDFNGNMLQFELVDNMNGIIQVNSTAPNIQKQRGVEDRIELELVHALRHLDSQHQEPIKSVADSWLKARHSNTNVQHEVKMQ